MRTQPASIFFSRISVKMCMYLHLKVAYADHMLVLLNAFLNLLTMRNFLIF